MAAFSKNPPCTLPPTKAVVQAPCSKLSSVPSVRSSASFAILLVLFLLPCVSAQNVTSAAGSVATSGEQHAYWIVSIIFNFISLCVQAYLFYMYYQYDILHKVGVSAFIMKSIGDFIFAMTYFVHHLGNISTDGGFASNHILCDLTTAATSVSIFLDFYSDMSISYIAWLTVRAATSQREVWVTPGRLLTGAVLACIMGLMWFLMMFYDGAAGPFYGLYCFTNSWAHFSSGGVLFIATATCITVMAINYYRLFLFVKANTLKNEKVDMSLRVALRGVMLIAVQMFTWFPLLISTIINIAAVPPNIPFEIFAGWSVKVNIFVGSMITMSFIRTFANKLKSDSRSASTTQGPPPPVSSSVDKDAVRELRLSMGPRSQISNSVFESKQPASPAFRSAGSSITMMNVRV